jgi:hypothetical protein
MADGAELVRTLYKSITSCSDHHSDDVVRRLHIDTPVDDAIVRAANKEKVVIVTGNPGDGKTHLIRRVGEQFPASIRRDAVKSDANELEDADIVKAVSGALERKRGLILAINEGILLEICERNRARIPWAAEVADRILRPFVYGNEQPKSRERRIVILDLNLRNCLGSTVAAAALDRVLGLVEADAGAPRVLIENVTRLRDETVRARLLQLLDSIGRTGFHATMREVLGFIAYLTCGRDEAGEPRHYAHNAFADGQGALFDRVRELDPVRMPVPFLDDQLWNCLDVPADWALIDPGEYRAPGDRDAFAQRKRRAFFEHVAGQNIIRTDQHAIEREFSRLRSQAQSPEQSAIRLINNFFKPGAASDSLVLWMYHQYSVRPIRHLVSRQSVRAADLRISVPRLPDSLATAFPDYQPDHVVFHHRDMAPSEGLVIDRRLLGMLLEGDRSTGLGTRNLEAQKKIAGFFDRLARYATGQAVVSILRLETGVENQVGVDLETKTFFIPGG